MFYSIIFEKLTLRKTPSIESEGEERPVDLQDRIVQIEETLGDDGKPWWLVDVFSLTEEPRRGFIAASNLQKIPAHELRWPEEINRVQFISALTIAARKYGTNRDYLALVAQAESGIQNNHSSTNQEATGPFRFTPSTWNKLVEFDAQSNLSSGVRIDDIGAPWAQALMAALLTAQNSEALLDSLNKVATGVDLYIAHLFGLDAAKAVLAARDTNPTQPINTVLKEALGDVEADKLIQVNQAVLTSHGSSRTVADVIKALEQQLHDAIDKVAPDIAQLSDDLKFPRQVPAGEPPWLTVARAELAKRVREDPNGSNSQIEDYFATTTLGRASDDQGWCGAFVSFCLSQSENPVVRNSNLKSARAADWIKWGEAVTDPPAGAICILNAQEKDSSGHVGFFIRKDGNNVVLLGGNQGNAVSEAPFNIMEVRAYRWLNWIQTDAMGGGTTGAVDPGSRAKQAYDHLRGEFTHEQASGLVGNFMQESTEGLLATASNDHEGAIGIAQWRLERRANLQAFAAQRNSTETDFNVQLEFVTHELNSTEAGAKREIKACTTTRQAAIAVREFYERAQPHHDDKRIRFAEKVAELFPTT